MLDILIAARKILQFTEALSYEAFIKNDMAKSAIIRELQVIGEAARLISERTKKQYSTVDWQAIMGMRNRLVHEYFEVRIELVWQTAREDVPDLINKIEPLVPPEE